MEDIFSRSRAYKSYLKMVNIAKFKTLNNNLWDKHGEVEIFSDRSQDNKSASDNNDCVPSEAQTEPCLFDRSLLSLELTRSSELATPKAFDVYSW